MAAPATTFTDVRSVTKARTSAVPWFLYAVLFASTSIITGLHWDISWHKSIGRDTFWSPPHLAIYLGGIVAGLSAAWMVFKTTLAGSAEERRTGVRIWGFTGPLGAYWTIWGAVAMLTSAPFDDWWHNTYGLDVKILSPPHVVLALGMISIQIGAMLTVLAVQNRAEAGATVDQSTKTVLRLMYVYAAGLLLNTVAVLTIEYMTLILMHSSIYYLVGCLVMPLFIVAVARGSHLRWPATTMTVVYVGFLLLMIWILPLFPAEPKLGPVLNPTTRMTPPTFPHLLFLPAIAIDLWLRRSGRDNDWKLAGAIGLSFFAIFFCVQWLFGYFLMSPYARNWFFGVHLLGYYLGPRSYQMRFMFYQWDASTASFVKNLVVAGFLAVASTRVALWWGNWMRKVQR